MTHLVDPDPDPDYIRTLVATRSPTLKALDRQPLRTDYQTQSHKLIL